MKELLLTATLSLFLTIGFAQENKKVPLTAGDHLVKARTSYFAGTDLQMAGIGIIVGSSLSGEGSDAVGGMVIGSLFAIGGTAFHFLAWDHIGKAGKKINGKGLSLSPGNQGLSLCYKF